MCSSTSSMKSTHLSYLSMKGDFYVFHQCEIILVEKIIIIKTTGIEEKYLNSRGNGDM